MLKELAKELAGYALVIGLALTFGLVVKKAAEFDRYQCEHTDPFDARQPTKC
jgi:hypothetical protein